MSAIDPWTGQWGSHSVTTALDGDVVRGELARVFDMAGVAMSYPLHMRDEELLLYHTGDFFKPHTDRARPKLSTDEDQCVTHLGTLLLVVPGIDCKGSCSVCVCVNTCLCPCLCLHVCICTCVLQPLKPQACTNSALR